MDVRRATETEGECKKGTSKRLRLFVVLAAKDGGAQNSSDISCRAEVGKSKDDKNPWSPTALVLFQTQH
jgi:hypothetical protein